MESTTNLTSASLIVRVKTRDPVAWRRLADLYSPIVYEWARRAGLQEADASDVVQEVFQVVARQIDDFEYSKQSPRFRGWLWGITRHKLIDLFRDRKTNPRAAGGSDAQWDLTQLPEKIPDSSSDLMSGFSVLGSLAHRALRMMETDFAEKTWQAFWRVTVEGQAAKDVAEDLGLSVGAVYTAKSRVLAHLRRELSGLD